MSVCIKITGEYYLRSDPLQWMISTKRPPSKDKRERWNNLSFHTTPKSAIESLCQTLARLSGANDLDELVQASRVIEKMAENAMSEVLKVQDNITLKVTIQ